MDVIKATLHSYKSLATRKQLQITLEVPQEYAETALKMLGVADPTGTQWFALTRIKQDDSGPIVTAANLPASRTPSDTKGEASSDKPRHFRDMKRSNQAALKCDDPAFQEWLTENHTHGIEAAGYLEEADFCAAVLRDVLGITSRSELDTMPSKGDAWDKLIASFEYRHQVRA